MDSLPLAPPGKPTSMVGLLQIFHWMNETSQYFYYDFFLKSNKQNNLQQF